MATGPPAEPPIMHCKVCKHRHAATDRIACAVCGHIGHPGDFVAHEGPTDRNLHFVAKDVSAPAEEWKGHLLLATILRKQVFYEEMGLPEAAFDYGPQDQLWRHVFAQKGDAPLAYVRWNVSSNAATGQPVYGQLDMLCVKKTARRKNIAKQLIGFCFVDIWERLKETREFTGMYTLVPTQPPHVLHTFGRLGFQPVDLSTTPVPPGLPMPVAVPAGTPPRQVVMRCPIEAMHAVVSALKQHAAATAKAAAAAPPPVPPAPAGGAAGVAPR